VTRGSDLGIVLCRMASADAAVNGGVGFKIEPAFLDMLTELARAARGVLKNAKVDSDLIDYSKPFFHWDTTFPGVRVCKG
jgi:hypothetical protein